MNTMTYLYWAPLTLVVVRVDEKVLHGAAFWDPTRICHHVFFDPLATEHGTLQKPTEMVTANLLTLRLDNPPPFLAFH